METFAQGTVFSLDPHGSLSPGCRPHLHDPHRRHPGSGSGIRNTAVSVLGRFIEGLREDGSFGEFVAAPNGQSEGKPQHPQSGSLPRSEKRGSPTTEPMTKGP